MIAKRVPNRLHSSSIARLARYIVNAQGGLDPRSWARTADYILDSNSPENDKGEKVSGVRVTNCGTDDPAAATIIIESTQAANTRAKGENTYHLVFSFPPGEQPSLDVLHAIEDDLCAAIGLADHQRVSAVHIDRDHLHVHVAINKVHPETFRNIDPYRDKLKLMEACERLEAQHGLQRTNHGLEKQNERGRDIELGPEHRPADRDSRFREYLRKSYDLAITERPEAKTLNDLRNLSSCGMAHASQGTPVLLQGHARDGVEQSGEKSPDSLRWSGNGDRTDDEGRLIGSAAANIEAQTGIATLARYVAEEIGPNMRTASSWQDLHELLAEHGLVIKPRGAGLVIGDPEIPLWVRASQCGREYAFKAMTNRLGPYVDRDPEQDKDHTSIKKDTGYRPEPLQSKSAEVQKKSATLWADYQHERQSRFHERKARFNQLRGNTRENWSRLYAWRNTQLRLTKLSKGVVPRMMRTAIKAQTEKNAAFQRSAARNASARIVRETKQQTWLEWLAHKAEQGDLDALDVLRDRIEREQKLRDDLLTAEKAEAAKTILLKALKPKVQKDGSVIYRTKDGGSVVDHKSFIQASTMTAGSTLLALNLAEQRFQGQEIIIRGTDEFKDQVKKICDIHKINLKVVYDKNDTNNNKNIHKIKDKYQRIFMNKKQIDRDI